MPTHRPISGNSQAHYLRMSLSTSIYNLPTHAPPFLHPSRTLLSFSLFLILIFHTTPLSPSSLHSLLSKINKAGLENANHSLLAPEPENDQKWLRERVQISQSQQQLRWLRDSRCGIRGSQLAIESYFDVDAQSMHCPIYSHSYQYQLQRVYHPHPLQLPHSPTTKTYSESPHPPPQSPPASSPATSPRDPAQPAIPYVSPAT